MANIHFFPFPLGSEVILFSCHTRSHSVFLQKKPFAGEREDKAVVPLYTREVGTALNIFSPGFPDMIPAGKYQIRCQIQPVHAEPS